MSGDWSRRLGVDLRSLALFRIGLGAYLLLDLLRRFPILNELYSDDGFLPRDARVTLTDDRWLMSLHFSSGSMIVYVPLMLVAVCFAVGVLVGYRTRFCTIGSWILFASMHVRNPFVDGLAENVVIMLLFWAMFIPLGARWSADAAFNPEHANRPNPYFSVAVLALMLQVGCVYWFTTLIQSRELFPQVSWLSPGTIGLIKVIGPALVFLPFATDAVRFTVALVFISMHLAAASAAPVPRIEIICAIAWTIFLPRSVWAWLDDRLGGRISIQKLLDRVVESLPVVLEHGPAWLRQRLRPRPAARELGMAGKTIVLVALALTVTGYASEETAPNLRLPSGLEAIATAAQLGQPWPGSPQARASDGWFVVLGTRLTGTQVDLLRDGPVNWARPSGSLYLDDRYARYMMWLLDPTMAAYRPYYAGSFCQRYNSRVRGPTAKLGKVRVYYMRAGNGGGPTKSFLLEYSCPK